MSDISTKYLGFKLKNPIVVSSSGITSSKDKVIDCVKAGAGAVVLKSIFEEQITKEVNSKSKSLDITGHTEALEYINRASFEHSVHEYLKFIEETKKSIDVPLLASLNCSTSGKWSEFAKRIENAGADGIELNIFLMPDSIDTTAEDIEKQYVDILKKVKSLVKIPVGVKLGYLFTNVGNIAKRLDDAGADSIILFNRFQSVEVNDDEIDNPSFEEGKWLSLPEEKTLTKRWITKLHSRIKCELSATSGIRTGSDVLEQIKAGANVVQVASVLYLNGVNYISEMISQLEDSMKNAGIKSIDKVRGTSSESTMNKSTLTREMYFKVISALNEHGHL